MLKNYFTIAFRNLRKHKFYTFINIFGLSVGVAICMIISLFVINELSYDTGFKDADRIYRIKSEIVFGGNHWNIVQAPAPLAAALPDDFPEVEAAVHFRTRGSYLVKREDENIKEQKVVWAGKDFFTVFGVPMLAGNPESALSEPQTMAISASAAEKYFPNEDALGKSLILDNDMDFRITGVYQDIPKNSHFHFDFLLAAEGLGEAKRIAWLSNNFQTYFKLRENADPDVLAGKLTSLIETHMEPEIRQIFGEGSTIETLASEGGKFEFGIQPLRDIHLKSDLEGEFEPNFNITYIYLFVAVALFILVIACINFMNLSTARSANRAKEVGIRKVMGSFRSHLIRQFLMESILLSIISFLIAVPILTLLLPFFNELAGRELTVPFSQLTFYGILIIGAIGTGLLAGVYPAFFLSGFKPISILKGKVSMGMKSGMIRSSLVVFQFAVSIILIIATIAVFNQLNYIQNKKIGFNKEKVITIDDIYALGDQAETFKREVLANSMMESGTITGFLPVSGTWRSDTPWWAEGKDAKQSENLVSLQNWAVDYDYVSTLDMKIVEGRDFSIQYPSDSGAVILNETAARNFNFVGDPIGQKIFTMQDSEEMDPEDLQGKTVVGIVENFHFESLKENIGPVMIFLNERPNGIASFRFNSSNTDEVVTFIESKWDELAPGQPFTYSFLDERFGTMYAAETRLGKVFAIFAGFAILIACLGLFALTAFTAEQRTKEIGIRKVLGSSVQSIVFLLSKEFTKLVGIAFLIASPIAWWVMNKWLEDYQYKITLGLQVFLAAGVFAAFIALLTISYQSVKAALSNPVNSLKSE
ncbi:putative ABC transport system permease protein [Algoriphagus locisalis]|uniref:Putative ABC transport system permease protein n=1 Tax=Algoriphagus locisalis TaxID=305507 RepID=A0A1I7BQM6_9BACT|nr:ABC transporter permease [Algoriphagus locisalis]SFT89441.1 putative ABC transport system permease protein [Algoriphagus locisalis]